MIETILISIMGTLLIIVEVSLIFMIYKLRTEVTKLTQYLKQMIEQMFGQVQEIKKEANQKWWKKLMK